MRIVLIMLSIAALVFIGSILYMFASKDAGLPPLSNTGTMSLSNESIAELLRRQSEDINAIRQEVSALKNGGSTTTTTPNINLNTPTQTGTVVPVSAKFLGLVMPTVELTLIPNNGIYDLRIFDTSTTYSTYEDAKFGMTVVASMTSYAVFLNNFKALDSSVYTVNETNTFPFKSFFVNPPSSDTLVRLVIQVEAETLLISIPKTKYEQFKTLILTPKS